MFSCRSYAAVAPAAKKVRFDEAPNTVAGAASSAISFGGPSKGFDASSFTFDLAAADEACDT